MLEADTSSSPAVSPLYLITVGASQPLRCRVAVALSSARADATDGVTLPSRHLRPLSRSKHKRPWIGLISLMGLLLAFCTALLALALLERISPRFALVLLFVGAAAAVGSVIAVIGVTQSERRAFVRGDDAARASERRNASLIRASLDAIVTIDGAGAVIEFNPAAESLFGYSESEAVGKNLGDLIVPKHLQYEFRAALARRLSSREGLLLKRVEMPAQRRDGSEVIVELTITALDGSDPPLFTWFLRDITQEKAAQARIARLLSDLREADRNKTDFLATLSHELRGPLAPLRSAVELIAHAGATTDAREKARNIITRQVHVMERLVSDLLDISRISSNKLDLRDEHVEVTSVLHSAVETSLPLIRSKRQQLETSVRHESITVAGDSVRLAQVFANLLTNASKYTGDDGKIWLTVERQGNDAVVTVKDTGIGIAPEMLPRVFEKFWQADMSADQSRGGLGIGLTLVKRLVEMHRGTVEVRSDGRGRGTEVIVRLPLLAGAQPSDGPTES